MYFLDLQNRQTEMKTLIGKEDWKQGIGNEQSEVKNSAKRELFIFCFVGKSRKTTTM